MQLPQTMTWREILAGLLALLTGALAGVSEMRRSDIEQRCAETVERAVAAQREQDAETLKIVVDIAQGRR